MQEIELISRNIKDYTNPHSDIFQILSRYCNLDTGPWIAGGYLRRILMNDFTTHYDIDVFYTDRHLAVVEIMRNEIRELKRRSEPKWLSLFGITDAVEQEPPNVQFTSRPLESVEMIIRDFDFTVTQFVSDGQVIVGTSQAYRDIELKHLRIGYCDRTTPHRIFRYISYGLAPDLQVLETMHRIGEPSSYYVHEMGDLRSQKISDLTSDELSEMQMLSRLGGWLIDFERNIVMIGLHPLPLISG